ncbi:hypothetical protein ABW19_dt0206094 [Dactylella cylindrospora]|nr:hypothetical protein ABW19_dt0206094 [Dactylella cylindrospora]
MGFSFSFSLWIVNGFYDSDWDSKAANRSTTTVIDDCRPANLISAGFALWLVLVPAVACVSQLPGSTFLFKRSNFYRFSPELGLVEALSTITLVIKGLLSGFSWHQSVCGVLVVREGIGQGDLWWRRDINSQQDANTLQDPTSVGGPVNYTETVSPYNESGEPNIGHTLGNIIAPPVANQVFTPSKILKRRLKQITNPLSAERILGVAIFSVSFMKGLIILAGSGRSEMLVPCVLALSYSFNFLVLEILTWTLLIPTHSSKRVKNMPPEHLMEFARTVDPGDNPFTFPAVLPNGTPSYQWKKTIAILTSLPGFAGPLVWIALLSNLRRPSTAVLVIIITVFSIFGVRSVVKLALSRLQRRYPHLFGLQYVRDVCSDIVVRAENTSMRHENLFGVFFFFISWIFRRVSVANSYSCIWIGVICYYFARVFPLKVLEGGEQAPSKPGWIDWLG